MARIEILLPNLAGGGTERVRLTLARAFRDLGHEAVFVLMSAQGELLEEALAEFEVIDLACPRARRLVPALRRHFATRHRDAVLAGLWPLTTCAAIAASLSSGNFRVLVTEHNALSQQYGTRGGMYLAGLRLSLAVGNRLADECGGVSAGVVDDVARLSGMHKSRYTVLPNPVCLKPFSNDDCADAESLWHVPKGGRIITVGKFKAQKNHILLLRSFARIATSCRQLVLLGNGPLEEEIKAEVERLGISRHVSFAGFKSNPYPYLQSADLFVLSSNYEGWPNVLNEALACGLPIVSTRCDFGPAEILDEGRYGTLVPTGNVVELAKGMEDALLQRQDPLALQQRAGEFTPEAIARRYLSLLCPGERRYGREQHRR